MNNIRLLVCQGYNVIILTNAKPLPLVLRETFRDMGPLDVVIIPPVSVSLFHGI